MKKNGCLTWIIGFFVVCLLIGLYSLAWIPAIGFIIYYLIKKDYSGTRKRNFIISIIIFITSLLLFIWGTNSSSLTDIQADWGKTTFDVSETVEVKITPTPSDAKIEKLTLSDNDIAKLKYKDGKDIVYELREYQPTEQFDERKAITEQLESLTGKEERIKASYREGIDTLEEYKANKAIIQKERESLEQQLKELKKAAHKSDQDPADSMLQKVRSVYDILISNNYTYVQKNEALKQIIDKIIYDRKNNSLKIYFFLYR